MYQRRFVLLTALPSLLFAAPLSKRDQASITAADIIAIDSTTSSCTGAAYPSECVIATDAAPWIALSYQNFGIESFGAQAALLALMLYESGSFKYNINHWPGVAGQGTRNMQSPGYNLQYATWLASTVTDSGITAETATAAEAEGAAAVLALVAGDLWSFASAAWFLKTQCAASIESGLAAQTEAGWEAYLSGCVGTDATDERTVIWRKTMELEGW